MPPSGGSPASHVIIVGGGLAGLSAAYDLLRSGHRVTLFEVTPDLGGLASSFLLEGNPVDRLYHFICRSDRDLIRFLADLGLSGKLHWRHTHTAIYHAGRLYPFSQPFDLINFTPVPWMQRIRFGVHILRSFFRSNWKWLDPMPAKAWLIENIGEEAYQVIWHPLLRIKFGDSYDKISAAWIWHRIWRVAQSRQFLFSREVFGWLERGSATLTDALSARLRAHPACTVRTNTAVERLQIEGGAITGVWIGGEFSACDAVLSTVALPILDRLIPGQTAPYFRQARTIEYIGVVCLLLSLRHSFSRNFWLNINDPRISFNGIIEWTNLNSALHDAAKNILYIPYYLPVADSRYRWTDREWYEEYIPMLKMLNPDFQENWIKERHIFREPYAQAICVAGFMDRQPALRTPIRGLYVTDSTQFYPEDRTLSAAIRQGRAAANLLMEDWK